MIRVFNNNFFRSDLLRFLFWDHLADPFQVRRISVLNRSAYHFSNTVRMIFSHKLWQIINARCRRFNHQQYFTVFVHFAVPFVDWRYLWNDVDTSCKLVADNAVRQLFRNHFIWRCHVTSRRWSWLKIQQSTQILHFLSPQLPDNIFPSSFSNKIWCCSAEERSSVACKPSWKN